MLGRVSGLAITAGLLVVSLAPAPTAQAVPSPQAVSSAASNGPFLGEDNAGRAVLESASGKTKLPFRAVNIASFSSDGASLAVPGYTADGSGGSEIRVLRAGAPTYSLGTVPLDYVDELDWSPDGSSVLAKLGDASDGSRSLWRFTRDHAATKIADLPDISSYPSYAYDPQRDVYFYVRSGLESDEVWAIDGATKSARKVTDLCFSACGTAGELDIETILDADPNSGDVLVNYFAPNDEDSNCYGHCFGWLDPATGAVHFAATSASVIGRTNFGESVEFSVDGQQIAVRSYGSDDEPYSRIVDHDLRFVADVPGEHYAWQPCPGSTCPVFTAPPPPTPGIGAGVSGAKGGKVNAGVKWTFTDDPDYEFAPATGFEVQWGRLDSKNHIGKTGMFSVAASARRATKTLAAGRYKFRVRAKADAGTGSWSGYSSIATAR